MTLLTRRSLLGGIGAMLAAPAIVRAASLMPVKALSFIDDGTFMPTYQGIDRSLNWWWQRQAVRGSIYRNDVLSEMMKATPTQTPEMFVISPAAAKLLA